MFFFKVRILNCILAFLLLVNGEVAKQEEEDTATKANSAAEDSPLIHDHGNRPRPTFSTNLFHNFLTQLTRPTTKIAGKTYGPPSVIAIIGDKPYISLEVFNKFSPFRWLMNAFQAKVNNICGFIAHQPEQISDSPLQIPENIFGQEGENHNKPLSGFGQALMGTGPVRIYDIPVNYNKNMKQRRT